MGEDASEESDDDQLKLALQMSNSPLIDEEMKIDAVASEAVSRYFELATPHIDIVMQEESEDSWNPSMNQAVEQQIEELPLSQETAPPIKYLCG